MSACLFLAFSFLSFASKQLLWQRGEKNTPSYRYSLACFRTQTLTKALAYCRHSCGKEVADFGFIEKNPSPCGAQTGVAPSMRTDYDIWRRWGREGRDRSVAWPWIHCVRSDECIYTLSNHYSGTSAGGGSCLSPLSLSLSLSQIEYILCNWLNCQCHVSNLFCKSEQLLTTKH